MRWRAGRAAAVVAVVVALCAAAGVRAADAAGSAPRAGAASHKPLWELGLGIAALHAPDYRGSDETSAWLLPLPYVVYRGRVLRADRDGARALLFDSERVEFDISLHGTVPVRSGNAARSGMPELPATVELGPAARVALWRSADARTRLELRVPARSVISVERSPRVVGATFTPHLQWLRSGVAGGWNVGLQAGPVFGNRRYHAHYYGVDAVHATAQRPSYAAPGGYGGWHAMATASRRYERMWVGAFVRHDSLRGAAFAASPLVRSDRAWMAGLGVAWVIGTSAETVPERD
jgi:outer membrane scaffolding protein for murein synthesis (MipA/OmpV family)